MGNKRFKHLNELRTAAVAGDRLAQEALARELWVPHHNRPSHGIGRYNRARVDGTHVTAKTHKSVRCVGTPTALAALPDQVRRFQMLKDRRDARQQG